MLCLSPSDELITERNSFQMHPHRLPAALSGVGGTTTTALTLCIKAVLALLQNVQCASGDKEEDEKLLNPDGEPGSHTALRTWECGQLGDAHGPAICGTEFQLHLSSTHFLCRKRIFDLWRNNFLLFL